MKNNLLPTSLFKRQNPLLNGISELGEILVKKMQNVIEIYPKLTFLKAKTRGRMRAKLKDSKGKSSKIWIRKR
jgi:hypothetical protein